MDDNKTEDLLQQNTELFNAVKTAVQGLTMELAEKGFGLNNVFYVLLETAIAAAIELYIPKDVLVQIAADMADRLYELINDNEEVQQIRKRTVQNSPYETVEALEDAIRQKWNEILVEAVKDTINDDGKPKKTDSNLN